jgi:hypothetical protein
MGALIITPELFWGEADYVRSVLVTGNVFEYVGYGMQSYGGVGIGAVDPDGALATPGGHVNISIINNTWRNISYCNMWLSSAAGGCQQFVRGALFRSSLGNVLPSRTCAA